MSVDTKCILIGAPSPEEIAAVLRNAFSTEVRVGATSIEDMFRIEFRDPEGRLPNNAEFRSLAVFPDYVGGDDADVYSGRRTLCNLGAFGGAVPIVDTLAKRFGGYVLENDSTDDWRFVAPADEVTEELPPEDRLRIEIAQIFGNKAAVEFSALLDSPGKMDRLIEAYSAYRDAKEASASPGL